MDDLRWMGLHVGRGRRGRRRRSGRIGSPSGSTIYADHARQLLASGAGLLLLLFGREARGRSAGDAEAGPAAEVRGHLPRDSARTRRRRASRRARRRSSGCACRRAARSSSTTSCAAAVTFHTDVIGDPVLVRSDGMPAYNFAVVDRRCADAGDARGARRGPHLEHAAPGAAVRGVRLARRRPSRTSRW